MKVLIDHQIFEMQKFGGISRYFYELLSRFSKNPNIEILFPLRVSDNEYIKGQFNTKPKPTDQQIIDQEYQKYANGLDFKGKSFLFKKYKTEEINRIINDTKLINKQASIAELKKQDFDIFHATFYDDYFLEYLNGKPYVITVYDLITEIFPEYALNRSVDKSKKILENASAVIAISECTKKDLIDFYGIDENKIHVTYLASSLTSTNEVSQDFKSKIPSEYLLFVGVRSGYKNFYFFAQSFKKLIKKYPDLKLVCTGSPFSNDEKNFLDVLGILDKTQVFFVNDDELVYLYKNTKCFVFPSLYEGFGIPVLEALGYDCPIAVSKSSSLLEVGGDVVNYFDPKDINSITDTITLVIESSKEVITQKYKDQFQKFSWEKTSRETYRIYKGLV